MGKGNTHVVPWENIATAEIEGSWHKDKVAAVRGRGGARNLELRGNSEIMSARASRPSVGKMLVRGGRKEWRGHSRGPTS